MEDPIAWCYPNQWKHLAESTTIPICTGEDIYLAESFRPLLENGGIGIAHPDALTCGGILETKKLGDLAQTYGVRMALHQAATPIHAMAAAHIGVATENCWACEFHANDVPWWDDLIVSRMRKPLIQNGFIEVPEPAGSWHRRHERRGYRRAHLPAEPRRVGADGRVESRVFRGRHLQLIGRRKGRGEGNRWRRRPR